MMTDEILELERLRKSQNMSLRQVAGKLGCTEKSLSNWIHSPIQPSSLYMEKINKLIVELRAIENDNNSGPKIKSVILDVVNRDWFDKPISESPQESKCLLWRILRLTELREVFHGDIYSDSKIIQCLEALARSGKIKVFSVRAVDLFDFQFFIEIGKGEYDFRRVRVEPQRFYKDKSLTEKERMMPSCMLDIAARCEVLEKERRAHFAGRFGRHQNLDGRMAREDFEDDVEKRRREERLLKATESLAEGRSDE